MTKTASKRSNLHEVLRRGTFEHAVLCTYTLNPRFFEDYCLEKFDTLSRNPNISVLTDRHIYNDILDAPPGMRPRQANVRYLLHPVDVPGCFHPKLFLFVGKKKGRLVIGSANFTRQGITSNAELVAVFEYVEEKDERWQPLFRSAYELLVQIASDSRSEALESNLRSIGREAPWITEAREAEEGLPRLLHNLDTPLWEQIASSISGAVSSVDVLSLFFDSQPGLIRKTADGLGPKRVRIFTENGRTTLTQDWLDAPSEVEREFLFVSYKDDDYVQPLHGKAIYIHQERQGTLVFGSANFTTPALLRTASSGNLEVVLLLQGVNTKTHPTTKLFDPCRTAHRLADGQVLESAPPADDRRVAERCLLLLREVEVDGEELTLDLSIPETLQWDRLVGHLTLANEATSTVKIDETGKAVFRATLTSKLLQRLDEGSSVIMVEALDSGASTGRSNRVLVTNLLECRSGQSLRRSRHIREAQENTDDFFRVLNELLRGTDESALLVFLNLCDIPVLEASRPGVFRRQRAQWDGGEGMRSLGKRNLVVYRELHEAAIAFFDRHFRKLRRHVDHGSLRGVSNYLHIFFAMGGVLRAQTERLVQGLEAGDEPIDIQTWSTARTHLDAYYLRFRELSECLYDEYLSKLTAEYGWKSVRKEFADEFEDLSGLRENMLGFRDRLEDLRSGRLWVLSPSQGPVRPKYFSCVFEENVWRRFVSGAAHCA